ncbi:hypothetical protein HKX48_006331 [Thoreauomyces humboldtii]|nr:hypothetical protein HKX48_006331 [Thoreauomyces humboldtii]
MAATAPLSRLVRSSRNHGRSTSSSTLSRFASSNTRRPTTAPASPSPTFSRPDLSKAARVHIKHPRTIFREQMTVKRKSYFAESLQIKAKKEAALADDAHIQEQRRAELEQKIREFKAARKQSFSGSDETAAEEALENLDHPSPSTEKSGTQRPATSDPLFLSRQRQWQKYREARDQQRLENAVHTRVKQSQQRTESLLYLYHAARDFVTYDNVDRLLRELTIGHNYAQQGPTPLARFKDQRREALKDTLEGTVRGRVGVAELKAAKEGDDAEEAQRTAEFLEKRKRVLDGSRAAPQI